MKLWCCGSDEFYQSIQSVAAVERLREDSDPSPGEDAVVLDLDHNALDDALDTVARWTQHQIKVIVACEQRSLKRATRAARKGAHHIALKPVDHQDLEGLDEGEPGAHPAHDDVAAWRERFAPEIVGESPSLFEALEIASQAADTDCPVLITGESGTGKELLARAFHRASLRAEGAFIPVNCPAIPRELVESELFGHAKGAFTGATAARMGRFAAADNGTLFLDEIGEMDHNVQSKLLRVLQDYQITRVGESRSQRVDVRVIAATNRDLEDNVSRGSFREDLYYRLNVIQVHLPPLRERRDDIPLLLEHFLATISQQRRLPAPTLGARARDALLGYSWPGNIRQLRNIVERLVILRRGREVELKHLPSCVTRDVAGQPESDAPFYGPVTLPADGINLRSALQRFEDSMIKQALLTTGGNKNQAAKILGLNRTTLVEKLRKRNAA